jgi:hypothetical protein
MMIFDERSMINHQQITTVIVGSQRIPQFCSVVPTTSTRNFSVLSDKVQLSADIDRKELV